jgi:hypothetical protein
MMAALLNFHSAHQSNSPRMEMSLHLDTKYRFRVNQSVLLHLNICVLSGDATNTNFIVLGFTGPGLKPTIYRTRVEHASHYTIEPHMPLRCFIFYIIKIHCSLIM